MCRILQAQASEEYDFTWLHTLETVYSYLVQWEDSLEYRSATVTSLTGVKVYGPPLCQAKCKTGPSFSLYFGFQYSFGFQCVIAFLRFSVVFLAVIRWFRVFGIEIHIWIRFHFFQSFAKWGPGPPSSTFLTLAETSRYATGRQLNSPEQLLSRQWKCPQSTWIQQRYLHNCRLIKANADNEAIYTAFHSCWLR